MSNFLYTLYVSLWTGYWHYTMAAVKSDNFNFQIPLSTGISPYYLQLTDSCIPGEYIFSRNTHTFYSLTISSERLKTGGATMHPLHSFHMQLS